MSVYGTGCHALRGRRLFSPVWLPALSARPKARGTVGFQSPYALQRRIPYLRGSVTPGSSKTLHGKRRNLDRLYITFPLRVRLSPRLTLIRLTLFRKPWAFGVRVSTRIVVTYAYIFFSHRSSMPRRHTFHAGVNAPLPLKISLESLASAAVLMPAHHPRVVARLVSCYALFE